jgi:hypothetical protein
MTLSLQEISDRLEIQDLIYDYSAIIAFLHQVMGMFPNHQHLNANAQITVDGYRRTDAGWRISKRVEEKSYVFNMP